MLKRFLIIFLLFISFIGLAFAEPWPLESAKNEAETQLREATNSLWKAKVSKSNAESNLKYLGDRLGSWAGGDKEIEAVEFYESQLADAESSIANLKWEVSWLKFSFKDAKEAYDNSEESLNDFTSRWFKIWVWDVLPWTRYTDPANSTSVKERTNIFFADAIQKLIIWLGSIALLIMTIWAWFMIIYHWEDNLLTKWKSIFWAWVISLILTIMSFYIVEFVKYLLW